LMLMGVLFYFRRLMVETEQPPLYAKRQSELLSKELA
jgi:hypothetical protein